MAPAPGQSGLRYRSPGVALMMGQLVWRRLQPALALKRSLQPAPALHSPRQLELELELGLGLGLGLRVKRPR